MDVFVALADPTRLQIVELLADGGEQPAGRIAASFDMTRAGVSRHLRHLEDAGLLRVRHEAQRRLYSLNAEPFAQLDDWLDRYRPLWRGKLAALARHLEENP